MYIHVLLAPTPQRNLVLRPLSESSNLAGALLPLVRCDSGDPLFLKFIHWEIGTK